LKTTERVRAINREIIRIASGDANVAALRGSTCYPLQYCDADEKG